MSNIQELLAQNNITIKHITPTKREIGRWPKKYWYSYEITLHNSATGRDMVVPEYTVSWAWLDDEAAWQEWRPEVKNVMLDIISEAKRVLSFDRLSDASFSDWALHQGYENDYAKARRVWETCWLYADQLELFIGPGVVADFDFEFDQQCEGEND